MQRFDFKDIKDVFVVSETVYITKNDGSSWVAGRDTNNLLGASDTAGKSHCKFFNSEEEANDVKKIIQDEEMTFVIKNDGSVWMCGMDYGFFDSDMTLESYSSTSQIVPILTKLPIDDVKDMFAMNIMSPSYIVHKNDDSLWAAGLSIAGAVSPNGYDPNSPNMIEGMEVLFGFQKFADDVEKFSYDTYGIMIQKKDGTLWYRGYNLYGAGGVGLESNCLQFTQVPNINGAEVKDFHLFGYGSIILKTDGTVMFTGMDMGIWTQYTPGSGMPSYKTSFTKHDTLTNIKSIVKTDLGSWTGVCYFITNNNEITATGSIIENGINAFGPNYIGQNPFGATIIETGIEKTYDLCGCLSFKKNNNIYTLDITTGQYVLLKDKIGITDHNIKELIACPKSASILYTDDQDEVHYGIVYNAAIKSLGYDFFNNNKFYCANDRAFKRLPIDNIKDIVSDNDTQYNTATFIITEDGKLYGKGLNEYGELGLGNTTEQKDFVLLPIDNVSKVSTSNYAVYVIKNNGELYTAGLNNDGQLGINNTTNTSTFTKVVTTQLGSKKVAYVLAGFEHAMLLTEDGMTYGVGNKWANGTSYKTYYFYPTMNVTSGVKQIVIFSDSSASLALKEDGTVWVCGSESYSKYFNLTNINKFSQVPGLQNIVKICTNHYNIGAYYLDDKGDLYSSGIFRASDFEVERLNSSYIVPVQKIAENVKDVFTDKYNVYLLKNDGFLYAGGDEMEFFGMGQNSVETFVPVVDFKVKKVFQSKKYFGVFGSSLFILSEDDELYATGKNIYGQFGIHQTHPNYMSSCFPGFIKLELPREFKGQQIETIVDNKYVTITDYACSDDHEIFISSDGTYVKGNAASGQLGDVEGDEVENFTKLSKDSELKEVECNDSITILLSKDGTLSYMGEDKNKVLGPNSAFTLKNFKVNHVRNKRGLTVIETFDNEIFVAGKGSDFTKTK